MTDDLLTRQIQASADRLLCDQFYVSQSGIRVDNAIEQVARLRLSKTWCLRAESHREQLVGTPSGNRLSSAAACQRAARETVGRIERGELDTYVNRLEHHVMDDLKNALWSSSTSLGKYPDTWQHSYACSRCHGRGENTCGGCGGRGRVRCGACSGGKITCSSCAGSGYSGTAPSRYACGGCGGAGRVNCYQCAGQSEVRCGRCGGGGTESCTPCRSTGQFTDRYSVTVTGEGQLDVTPETELAPWQSRYLQAAVNQRVDWVPLRSSCRVDLDQATRHTPAYPIGFSAEAQLRFAEADLAQGRVRGHGFFVGEHYQGYDLAGIGDGMLGAGAEMLDKEHSVDNLAVGLTNGVAETLLAHRAEPARLGQTLLVKANLVSSEAINGFFDRYRALLERLQARRAEHSVRDWSKKAGAFTLVFLAVVAVLDALYGNQVGWEYGGLQAIAGQPLNFVISLGVYTSYIWVLGLIPTFGLPALIIIGVYLLLRRWLFPRRKRGKLRFLIGLLATTWVLITLYWLLGPLLSAIFSRAPALPGPASLVTGAVHSLLLLPEAILCGLLASALRLRANKDQAIKRYTAQIASEPLMEDLGYR
ncbi:ECF transporter S component [Marinimicrobium sp. LS-A18]|uniref:ECF transporter S component n=1 Tax=Marinimicrobium sp. LS-A18 TaxID=1381596 RepID=UPI00046573D1|nr:ECF transporter S component [Marinimicrobium sp. LS-A18]